MKRLAKLVVEHRTKAWLGVFFGAFVVGGVTGKLVENEQIRERQKQLDSEASRTSLEIASETMNGNIMGALSMLGLLNNEIKREARGEVTGSQAGERMVEFKSNTIAVSQPNLANMESIGGLYSLDGTFLVRQDGRISAAWYSNGKPTFGSNIKFRPYFQMAMKGSPNVYAAVGTGTGERMLYFAAPVFSGTSKESGAIGAIVARLGMQRIDRHLQTRSDIALLLSPQKMVFASSRPSWIGHFAGIPSPEEIKAIKEIRQFGDMFSNKDPQPLPIDISQSIHPIEGRLHALSSAKLDWNDPQGDWTLVMAEDLERSVPITGYLKASLFGGMITLLLGAMLLRMLRGQYAQQVAATNLSNFAKQQQNHAETQAAIAAAGLRLQQTKSLGELAQHYLQELRPLTGFHQGVVYIASNSEEHTFVLAASHACAEAPPERIREGETLLGQCAIERRNLVLDAPAEKGFWRIHSGLGHTTPRTILLAPVLLADRLLGLVELAFLRPAGEIDQTSIDEMNALLALNIEILRRNEETSAMLASTQAAQHESTAQAHFNQALIDNIPYPVFYKGADTRFLGFNRAYEEAFSVNREHLIGKRVMDLEYLPEADRSAYQAEDEAAIANAASIRHEMQIPFADGKLHDTLYFVTGFRHQDGTPAGLVGTFIDISEQKEIQREYDRLVAIKLPESPLEGVDQACEPADEGRSA